MTLYCFYEQIFFKYMIYIIYMHMHRPYIIGIYMNYTGTNWALHALKRPLGNVGEVQLPFLLCEGGISTCWDAQLVFGRSVGWLLPTFFHVFIHPNMVFDSGTMRTKFRKRLEDSILQHWRIMRWYGSPRWLTTMFFCYPDISGGWSHLDPFCWYTFRLLGFSLDGGVCCDNKI